MADENGGTITAGKASRFLATNGSLLIVLLALAFLAAGAWMFWGHQGTEPIAWVGLIMFFFAASVCIDLLACETRRSRTRLNESGTQSSPSERAKGYQPDLRIWGVGLVSAIGVAVLHPLAVTTMHFVGSPAANKAEFKNEEIQKVFWTAYTTKAYADLAQGIALLVVLVIIFGFVIWAIVRLCRSE